RFGIGGIVLIALDVRLHVLRRHQSHLVAKRAQLPPPVVRRRARLQANQTGRQLTEERQNLRTPKLLAQNRRSLCINPVHLKNMLRQVQSDRSNLAHGWLPFAAVSIRQQFGTQMPQGGHPPHHSITSSATERSDRLQELLRPTVVQVLIDPFLAAELSNAVLATQAFQHDTDLLFSGMMPACGSANIPDCLFSALRYALARLSHRCSSAGYDEPAILSYAISSFCPTSADGLHCVAAALQR